MKYKIFYVGHMMYVCETGKAVSQGDVYHVMHRGERDCRRLGGRLFLPTLLRFVGCTV